MQKLRKVISISVMALTVFVMSGLGSLASAASAQPGDLVKAAGNKTVYYLGSDSRLYNIPNEDTYFSWYKDWSGVITISVTDLNSYGNGIPAGFVTMRPGTRLIQRDVTTDNTVYAVETNGILRPITTANAIALYGSTWASRVTKVSDQNFLSYTVSTSLPTGQYPIGTLLKTTAGPDVFYFDGTNYRRIANEAAFNANRFNARFIVKTSMNISASGSEITGMESGLINAAQNGGTIVTPPVVVTGSGVTVSLNANTPAANDLPIGTSNSVLKFNVTAANNGPAVISGVKLTAIGLGNPSAIQEISVYKDNAKLNNTARNIDSNKEAQINFTNAVIIPAGTTATFEVRAKITDTAKHGLSIAKATDLMAGNTVSGSFPVAGNIFTGANVTVGNLTFDNDGSALSDVKLGDKGATVAKFKLSNSGNAEDITINAITFKKGSSNNAASDNAVENLKLNFDGRQVATAASISSRYVTFVLNSPITIAKNTANKRMTITADVVDGAAKSIGFAPEASSDIVSVGSYYGYQSTVSGTAIGTALEASIKAGSISVEKVNAAVDSLRVDVDNQEAGSFKITANSGKNAELSTLRLTITSNETAATTSLAYIENVEVFNKTNNTVYDLNYVSTTTSSQTKVYANTSMGLMLTSGVTNELVVRFDTLPSSSDKNYTVSIANATTDLIIKETGNDTAITDITPNTVYLKKVTVEGASAQFSLNALSSAFDAVIGTEDVEALNFNVKAGQNSDIYVRDLTVEKDSASSLPFTNNSISVIKLWNVTNGTPVLVKSYSSSQISGNQIVFTDLAEKISANSTNKYSVTFSFVKNTDSSTKDLKVALASATVEDVDGKTISEAGLPATSQRSIALIGTGSLAATMDNTNDATKYDSYQIAGSNSVAVASVKLKAANEDVKVTKLSLLASSSAGTTINNNISRISLYDGSTEVAYSDTVGATSAITGLNIVVPQTEKTYTIKVSLNKYGQNEVGELDKNYQFGLKIDEAQGVSSGDTVADVAATTWSKTAGVVATKISAVSLETTNGSGVSLPSKLATADFNNAAIIKVTVPTTSNTKSDGTELKAALTQIRVKVTGNAFETSADSASIERIGGNGATNATIDSNGNATFTINSNDVEVTGTAYYLVKVKTVAFVASTDYSMTVGLDKLNGTSTLNDFNFAWGESDGTHTKYDLRLPGITTISGHQLTN